MLNDKQRKLVEDNLNCIYAAVWKYCKNPEEDIFQDAVVAVCRAFPRFDPEKAEFTTWVYAVVRFMLRKKSEYNSYYPKRNEMNTDAPHVPFHYLRNYNINYNTRQDQIGIKNF